MNELKVIENELVPVYETSTGEKVVYGRELYAVLESKSRYNDWIRNRFNDCGAIENTDFETLTKNLVNGGQEKDHMILLDIAKEIAMLERNEKGKQVRRYFIEVEKKYKSKYQLPQTYAQALRELADKAEENERLLLENKEMKPKAEFFDAVTDSKDAFDMKDVANVLNYPGIGRNKLFGLLREFKILTPNNRPYQEYIDRGYFRTVEQHYEKPYGEAGVNIKTLVFQKGVDYIRKRLDQYFNHTLATVDN